MENQTNKKLPVVDLSDVKCKTCQYKKETNFWSSDGFDRMYDWVCSAHNNDTIASSLEWHDESRVQLPTWCPRIKVSATEKELVYVVTINKVSKPFSSESFAFDAVVDFLRQHFESSKNDYLLNQLNEIVSFKELLSFVKKERYPLNCKVVCCYLNNGFKYSAIGKPVEEEYNSVIFST